MTVLWVPQPNGPQADYQFVGLPPALQSTPKWLEPEVVAQVVGWQEHRAGARARDWSAAGGVDLGRPSNHDWHGWLGAI